jgi:transcriptional regulator with XRE-family HTH domain
VAGGECLEAATGGDLVESPTTLAPGSQGVYLLGMTTPSELKDQAIHLVETAVMALRKLMQQQGLSVEEVAQEMGWKREKLEQWFENAEEIGLEDFMMFWSVVVGMTGQDEDFLNAITSRELRRDDAALLPAEVEEEAPPDAASRLDTFLDQVGRTLQGMTHHGLVDSDRLEYLLMRSRGRRDS